MNNHGYLFIPGKQGAVSNNVTDTIHISALLALIIIIIVEICRRPTYQNILTAQGMYKSKNSDNTLQHKVKTRLVLLLALVYQHT